jgi:hypothetical protein
MRVRRLFLQVTLFYLVVTGAVIGLVALVPGFEHFLPIGGAESLLSGPAGDPFESVEIGAARVGNLGESILWLFIAVIGALLTMLPVSWTYMACRDPKEYDQSLIETMVVLPIAVTSIVVLVHNSLALAFSLAGIVGGVRFRNSLKSSGDALYVLIAIGVGLGAGIGALEVALVMSLLFNYVFLILWGTDYGALQGAHRYLRDKHKVYEPKPEKKEKEKEKEQPAQAEDADLPDAEE